MYDLSHLRHSRKNDPRIFLADKELLPQLRQRGRGFVFPHFGQRPFIFGSRQFLGDLLVQNLSHGQRHDNFV